MVPSFNLIDEKWIPCYLNGKKKEFGIADVFREANCITMVFDQSPPVTVSIHRLLLAIMHSAFNGPKNKNDWKTMWAKGKGKLYNTKLECYLTKWKNRFDLFDNKYPFYQTAGFNKGVKQPVSVLAFDLSSGNNAVLFDHNYDKNYLKIPAKKAAGLLLARQNYSPSAGKSSTIHTKDSPLTNTASVLIMGENLFETLMLNFHHYDLDSEIPFSGDPYMDIPAWEIDNNIKPGKHNLNGYIDYLTLQSRYIRLIPDANGENVENVYLAQGLYIENMHNDPFLSYRENKKTGIYALSFREGKSLWRDSHTLFKTFNRTDDRTERPKIIDWVSDLASKEIIPWNKVYNISVMGVCSDKAKLEFWRHENIPFPLVLLKDMNLVDQLECAITKAEDIYYKCLKYSMKEFSRIILFPDKDKKSKSRNDKNSINKFLSSLIHEHIYWNSLEIPFKIFIGNITKCTTASQKKEEQKKWQATLRESARNAFQKSTSGFQASGRNLNAIANAEIALLYVLKKELK